jgi:hypothetical protein
VRQAEVRFQATELVPFFDGVEKMKLETQIPVNSGQLLSQAFASGDMTAMGSEPFIYGGYLEVWFRCLKLSKQYVHNCRTGLFGSQGAANTFKLFGCLEHFTLREWWHERGCENFGRSMATFKVRLVVAQRKTSICRITLDADDETPAELVGDEVSFLIQQMRLLHGQSGMLSSAPKAWSIYKSRITPEAIKLHLDVLEAHDTIKRSAPSTKLWRIGEQLRLNPKAMTRSGDSPNEQTAKHITMGQTVSEIVRKGQGLVANACEGAFPKY